MADYAWPDPQHRTLIGKRVSRVDGPVKAAGRAKFTYDVHRPGLLYAKLVRSPYPHARIVSIDTSAAEKLPGVAAIKLIQQPGATVHWAGDEVVAIAAVDEGVAEDAARLVKVQYEPLPHFVIDSAPPPSGAAVEEGPLGRDDLDEMLVNQVPANQMVASIQRNGITFQRAEDVLQALAKNGATPPVIEALKTAAIKPAAGKVASWYRKAADQVTGEPDEAFKEAGLVISEGDYGASVITHACMETHGTVVEWGPDELLVFVSTQNISGIPGQMAQPLGIPASNIHSHQDHVGGGFGSKFGIDRWGIVNAQLSKLAGGKPVRMMLDRPADQEIAGARPSAYAHVRVGARADGTVTAWQSESWGTGGPGSAAPPPIPYVFNVPNRHIQHTSVITNIGPARAWRAPSHPQACLITMAALDDVAAKLGMDPLDLFLKNIDTTHFADAYRDEFRIADELMGWKKNWRKREVNAASPGPVKRGLGLSCHTWGGRGHASDCDLSVHPDSSVEIRMGSQDLGTGTRTIIKMVAADALGAPLDSVKLLIGDSRYPMSGGSGGSTTAGGVSSSTRRAAIDARDAIFAKVAPALQAQPHELETANGVIRVAADPNRSLTWKQACARLGAVPVIAHGKNPDRTRLPDLTNSGVGGVQMADVSVDTETGIVRVNKMVAAQDCGLVIDVKTAESQVLGAMIMGISYSLYEEKVMDPTTGRMLNPNLEFYRLAGIGDIPELVVHMMTGKGYDERGVIGLAEPPVVSPGAAISNAVANAIGVRVPTLPLTPDRVLSTLERRRV